MAVIELIVPSLTESSARVTWCHACCLRSASASRLCSAVMQRCTNARIRAALTEAVTKRVNSSLARSRSGDSASGTIQAKTALPTCSKVTVSPTGACSQTLSTLPRGW
eukprot:122138-Rhodomonas_salina.2